MGFAATAVLAMHHCLLLKAHGHRYLCIKQKSSLLSSQNVSLGDRELNPNTSRNIAGLLGGDGSQGLYQLLVGLGFRALLLHLLEEGLLVAGMLVCCHNVVQLDKSQRP